MVLIQGTNYDIKSFSLVSDHVLAGQDVYSSEDTLNRHPYLPLEMYWLAFAKWTSNILQVPFSTFVKLLPIAADAILSVIIYLYLRTKLPQIQAFFGGVIYAINPIAVMVSSYHGQFDAIPALFLVVSIWQAERSEFSSGWWLGLGVLVKSWPVLALPSLLKFYSSVKQRLGLLVFFSIAPILGVLFYMLYFNANFLTVIKPALSYNHGVGAYSYIYGIRLLSVLWPDWGTPLYSMIFNIARYFTLAILAVIWYSTARKENLISGLLTIFVSFFAFTHAFAIQYLSGWSH
jgi:hypothetical protein